MKDEIILNNLWLIKKVMKDLHCQYRDEEEYYAYYYAGLIGLIEASKTYDEKKGKSTYLYNGVYVRILNVFKYNTNPKRIKTPISLNTEVNDIEYQDLIACDYNLEKKVTDKILIEELLSELKDKKYKQFIIEYYGIGTPSLNMRELAEKYGVCQQNISQSIRRGLEKLKNIYLGEKNGKNKKNNFKNKIKIRG